MPSDYVFTSESVTEGHPDKLCDQISDALVGHYLRQDPLARAIAECAVSTGILFVSVKAAAEATVDIPNAVREVIHDVGYVTGSFNSRTCTVMTSLNERALPNGRLDERTLPDEALDQIVSRDHVTVFGYACDDTPVLMPLPIWLAHRLVRRLDEARKTYLPDLAPDGTCQAGIFYREGRPHRVHSITLVASQTTDALSLDALREAITERVVTPVVDQEAVTVDAATRIAINPEGTVVEGGPVIHAGLTGRKNGVDTYGEFARQSGSALSGKDPTRIDRVGAYAARHAAKNVVAAGLAQRCEVQLSYSIGLAEPVSVNVQTFGTGALSDEVLTERVRQHFDFRPAGIIRRFKMRTLVQRSDVLRRLAVYGHVGRTDLTLPWEATDAVDALR